MHSHQISNEVMTHAKEFAQQNNLTNFKKYVNFKNKSVIHPRHHYKTCEELLMIAAEHHAEKIVDYLINECKINVSHDIFSQYTSHLKQDATSYPSNHNAQTDFNAKIKSSTTAAGMDLVLSAAETPTEVLNIIRQHIESIEKYSQCTQIFIINYIQSIGDYSSLDISEDSTGSEDDIDHEVMHIIQSSLALIDTIPNEEDRNNIKQQCAAYILSFASHDVLNKCIPFIESSDIKNHMNFTLKDMIRTKAKSRHFDGEHAAIIYSYLYSANEFAAIKSAYTALLTEMLGIINSNTPPAQNNFLSSISSIFSSPKQIFNDISQQYSKMVQQDNIFTHIKQLQMIMINVYNSYAEKNDEKHNPELKQLFSMLKKLASGPCQLYQFEAGTKKHLTKAEIYGSDNYEDVITNTDVIQSIPNKEIHYFGMLDAKFVKEEEEKQKQEKEKQKQAYEEEKQKQSTPSRKQT